MAIVDVTEKDFGATVEKGIVLLDFWASWCGPCRTFAPVFEAAAARHPEVTFGKINIDDTRALAAALRVQAVPTLLVFRDGVLLAAQPGAIPGAALDELIHQVRTLDMQAVRGEVDKCCGPAAETESA